MMHYQVFLSVTILFFCTTGGELETVSGTDTFDSCSNSNTGVSNRYMDKCTNKSIGYCLPGTIRKNCTELRKDTSRPCMPVPRGFYMDSENNCDFAYPCTECTADEVVKQNCTGFSNTHCEPKPTQQRTTDLSTPISSTYIETGKTTVSSGFHKVTDRNDSTSELPVQHCVHHGHKWLLIGLGCGLGCVFTLLVQNLPRMYQKFFKRRQALDEKSQDPQMTYSKVNQQENP